MEDTTFLHLEEKLGFEDKLRFGPKGRAKIYQKNFLTDEKELLFEQNNKITLAGAGFLSSAMFDIAGTELTPSYNNALSLDATINTSVAGGVNKTCLFCVGIDGCGTENSQVYPEDYKHWIDEKSIIPFQYRPLVKDLSDQQRTNIYMGRKTLTNYYAYYFKKFDSLPIRTQQLTDGSPIDSTIYSSTSKLEAQTFVSMEMSVTPDDCRDYFLQTVGINEAKINSISLCTAWYKTINGFPVYQDIRPITRLNFPNECLINLEKGIVIDYSVYF